MTDERVGTTFGPYRIVDLIGRGGMGEVYRAYDTVKDREVALKLLPKELAGDASYRGRFEREARVAARLQEPHVIPIHDFGRIDDVLFMDMRLVRGKDLRTVLRRPEQMEVAFASELARQMSDALDAAHADGLVHRDVKPENILLLPSGFAYLADFGIAARTDEARMTSAGTAIGSFAYMAPERFQDAPVSPASDIYSLGCVLYECLAGKPPFPRGSVSAMIQAHLSDTPEPLRRIRDDVPPALEAVVARAMAKNPAHRFDSARAFGAAVLSALDQPREHRSPDPSEAATAATPQVGPAFSPRRPDESRTAVPLAGGMTAAARSGNGQDNGYGTSGGSNGGNHGGAVGGAGGGDTRPMRRGSGAALIAALAAIVAVAGFAIWKTLGNDGNPADAGGPGTGTTTSSTKDSTSTGPSTSTTSSTSSTTTTTSVSTQPNGHTTTVTVTRTNPPSKSTSSTRTTSSTSTSASTTTSSSSPTWSTTIPSGPGYDWQGWTGYAVLRCAGDDRAAMVAQTSDSMVTICESHSGTTYYLGLRPNQAAQPNNLRLANPVRSGGGWLAKSSTGTYSYLVTSSSLTISNANTGDARAEPVDTYVEAG